MALTGLVYLLALCFPISSSVDNRDATLDAAKYSFSAPGLLCVTPCKVKSRIVILCFCNLLELTYVSLQVMSHPCGKIYSTPLYREEGKRLINKYPVRGALSRR